MKIRAIVFILLLQCLSVYSFADYSDGWITTGEYEFGVIWINNNLPLIVEGGGQTLLK